MQATSRIHHQDQASCIKRQNVVVGVGCVRVTVACCLIANNKIQAFSLVIIQRTTSFPQFARQESSFSDDNAWLAGCISLINKLQYILEFNMQIHQKLTGAD